MQRITTATADPNGNGTGKAGFVNGTPPSVPPTQLDQAWFNQIQEELANIVESDNGTIQSSNKAQALATIRRLGKLYGGSAAGAHVTRTYQRVQDPGFGAGGASGCAWSPSLGRLVMVYSASQQASYSDDGGITWTHLASALPSARAWNSVCWANTLNLFVAVASDGTAAQMIATSADGITWTVRTAPSTALWMCVRFGAGLLVAIAYGGGTAGQQIMTSPDGVTWTIRTNPSPYASTTLSIRGLCWGATAGATGAGLFCAVGNSGFTMTSPDGITWTNTNITSWTYNSVAYSDELRLFVTVNGDAPAGAKIFTSPNGTTWTARTGVDGTAWGSMIWNGVLGAFACFNSVGGANTIPQIMQSYDGITWFTTKLTNPYTSAIVVGNATFVGRGDCSVAMPEWGRNFACTSNATSLVGQVLTSDSDRALVMGRGVVDGSNPASGEIGEIIEAQLLAASAVSRSTGNNTSSVVSLALPPGDWDVSGICNVLGSPTGFTSLQVNPSLVSGGSSGIEAEGALNKSIPPTTTASGISLAFGPVRASNSSTTTVIGLSVQTTYTGGTMTLYGKLRARRIR